jgi:hypothetical protein
MSESWAVSERCRGKPFMHLTRLMPCMPSRLLLLQCLERLLPDELQPPGCGKG